MPKKLTSVDTLVESPFIIVTIGGYTFGSYSGPNQSYGSRVQYPNFMKSLTINKVNGTINTYTITFEYQIRAGEDPNLLDKIFSKAVNDRKITLSYGDWNSPSYIYKDEVCIITNITSNVNFGGSAITYVLQCTSDAFALTSNLYNFPARTAKPSDVLKELVFNQKYGLMNVFTGMGNKQVVLESNFIASNDKAVPLAAMSSTNVLNYMSFLVDSMTSDNNTTDSIKKNSKYAFCIYDDTSNNFGGTYFVVKEVANNNKSVDSLSTYSIDVGYPGDNFVTQFNVTNDQSWAILYDYSKKINQSEYVYRIGKDGKVITEFSPSATQSSRFLKTTEADANWWNNMTSFPISATLTIKGLTRPSILMTYVKLNVLFYGQKHISSGLYIITGQQDTIDSTGYKTTLTLTRIGGDT